MLTPSWAQGSRPSLDVLLAWCVDNGIVLYREWDFRTGLSGGYDCQTNSIYLSRDLPQTWLLPTLAHETFHAVNQHAGHQPRVVEDRIDEAVALALVDAREYAYWESQYGWSTGGIACAMDLPRWLVGAYRRALAKRVGV